MAVAASYWIKRVSQRINFTKLSLGIVVALTIYIVLVPLVFLLWNSFHGTGSPLEAAPLTSEQLCRSVY